MGDRMDTARSDSEVFRDGDDEFREVYFGTPALRQTGHLTGVGRAHGSLTRGIRATLSGKERSARCQSHTAASEGRSSHTHIA